MITRKQYKSARDVKKYFDHSLAESDYHTDQGRITGHWNGKAARLLNLPSEVNRDQFRHLTDNQYPDGSSRLTRRIDKGRTVSEDFTFSAPKSVSIQYAVTGDEAILEALDKAVQDTMKEVEKDALTRVRKDGVYENRSSKNLLWASFIHDETRPIDREINGKKVPVPDPQLHVHNVIMNATFDEKEDRWKAVNYRDMVANLPYYRQLFGNNLAQNLQQAGYRLERTDRNFEIAGYQRSTIEKFSNRQRIIEKIAEENNITDPVAKSKLGAKTRSSKRKGLSKEALHQFRLDQLDHKELRVIHKAKTKGPLAGEKQKDARHTQAAVNYAIEHSLSRKSVVEHKELVRHALNYGKITTSKQQIEFAIAAHPQLRSKEKEGQKLYTNIEAHLEEKKLIEEAKRGLGKYNSINAEYKIQNELLSDEQKNAVYHALNSKDFITMISGRAGTGKTWAIKELAHALKENNTNFGAFAPSSQASRKVQREEGFTQATTVAELLASPKQQEQISGGMIWIDEAGMVGNADMNKVIEIAKKNNARILLTGDTRQHNSVSRGDAMRILETYSGITAVSITKNRRQKNQAYREAITCLSKGEMLRGFTSLEDMGAIVESEDVDAVKENVASEYVQAVKASDRAIVIAVTHKQGQAVTRSIRNKLKQNDLLEKEDRSINCLKNKSLDQAQKKDLVNYTPGNVIEFHQNVVGGFKRGKRYEVIGLDTFGNVLLKSNSEKTFSKPSVLPLNEARKYSVYEQSKLDVAKGDQIRITKSGYSEEKHRLENGDLMQIKGFDEQGRIKLHTGRKTITLAKDFGHLNYGYASTSPSAQGKTVNKVIIMQSSISGKATSQEQFYVSASRGRFSISVHTDDKELLLDKIHRSSQRMTALEVAGEDKKEIVRKENSKLSPVRTKKQQSKLGKEWKVKSYPTDYDPREESPVNTPPAPGIEPEGLGL